MTRTMKAVVFKGPRKIAIEDRPIPEIADPTDAVIKVSYTALCGRFQHRPPFFFPSFFLFLSFFSFFRLSFFLFRAREITDPRNVLR